MQRGNASTAIDRHLPLKIECIGSDEKTIHWLFNEPEAELRNA